HPSFENRPGRPHRLRRPDQHPANPAPDLGREGTRMKRTRLPALTLALVTLAAPLPLAVAAAPPTLELAIAPALELTPLAAAANPAIVAGDDTTAPLPPLSPNPRDWFVDHLALAATIAMVVQFLKKNVLRSLSGLSTVLASLATG